MLLRLVLISTFFLINTLTCSSHQEDLENVLVVVEKEGKHSSPHKSPMPLKTSGLLKWRFMCSDSIAQETRDVLEAFFKRAVLLFPCKKLTVIIHEHKPHDGTMFRNHSCFFATQSSSLDSPVLHFAPMYFAFCPTHWGTGCSSECFKKMDFELRLAPYFAREIAEINTTSLFARALLAIAGGLGTTGFLQSMNYLPKIETPWQGKAMRAALSGLSVSIIATLLHRHYISTINQLIPRHKEAPTLTGEAVGHFFSGAFLHFFLEQMHELIMTGKKGSSLLPIARE